MDRRTLLQALKQNNRFISPDGVVDITWLADEKRGFIDIINPNDKYTFKQLKGKAQSFIDSLPHGDWEFNPDTPQKGRIYGKLFKNAKSNPNMPNNALVFNNTPKVKGEILDVKKKLPDLSDYTWNGGHAAKQARALGLTEFTHNGEHVTLYEGKFKKPGQIAKRKGSQRRVDPTTGQPGTRLESQIRKEEVRIADKNKFEPLTPAEADEITDMKLKAKGDLDHVYGQSFYDEGPINKPSNRADLDPTINRGVKVQQEKAISQYMLEMELKNPSASIPIEETLDAAAKKPKWYADVISKVVGETNVGRFGRILGLGEVVIGPLAKAADVYFADQSQKAYKKNPNLDTRIQRDLDIATVGDPTPLTGVAGAVWANKEWLSRQLGQAKHPLKGFYR